MHTIKLNLKKGLILIDSAPLAVDGKCALNESIAKLCASSIKDVEHSIQYRLSGKASLYGELADCVIEVTNRKVKSVTFLFDFIEFFESSILESKIVIACEKSSVVKFRSDHPSVAFLDFEWGQAEFFYDARQGDLSLNIMLKEKCEDEV